MTDSVNNPPVHRELVERLRHVGSRPAAVNDLFALAADAITTLLDRLDWAQSQVGSAVDAAQPVWSGELSALQAELAEVKAERDRWKANHDSVVAKKRVSHKHTTAALARAERAESKVDIERGISAGKQLVINQLESLLAAALEEIGQASTELSEAAKVMRDGLGRPMPSLAEVYERASLRAATVYAQIKGSEADG